MLLRRARQVSSFLPLLHLSGNIFSFDASDREQVSFFLSYANEVDKRKSWTAGKRPCASVQEHAQNWYSHWQ
jgi:hypothetical protein